MPNYVSNVVNMPNYVSNVVKSDDEAVKFIREKYCNQNGVLDFNKIIPMPKSLDITNGSVADLELRLVLTALDPARQWYRPENLPKDTHRFSYTYQLLATHLTTLCGELLRPFTKKEFKEASKRFDLYGETYEQALANGIIRVANIEAFGHSTWYGWRRDKWGTKWNACDGGENGGEFYFDTVWNTPEPVIKRLSELMPGHKITVLYADEGTTGYNCGSYSYLNGEMVDSYLPEGGSKEAYEFCFENNFADKEMYRYDSKKGTYKYTD